MRYWRAGAAGGTYFFAVNLTERKRTLLPGHVDVLREVLKDVKLAPPFHIDAMVLLPDHLHASCTLPVDDRNYPMRWMLIKATRWEIAYYVDCQGAEDAKENTKIVVAELSPERWSPYSGFSL